MTINAKASAVLGAEKTVGLYTVGLLCTSLGYVVFHFSRRLIKHERMRKYFLIVTALGFMSCVICFMISSISTHFIIASLLTLLFFGCIGGFVHYTVSLFLFRNKYSGRVLGMAIAIATVLQFIIQNLPLIDIVLIISIMICVIVILYLAVKPVRDWMFENPLPYANKPEKTAKDFIIPMSIVAVMSLCFGLGDGLVTRLAAIGDVSLTSSVRLMYAVGIILAGLIADMSKRRFLPLVTLCSLLLFSSIAFFIGDGKSIASSIYIIIMYLFSGFYVMYMTLMFLDVAPMTEQPSLWAGMGRIIRGPFIAISAVISLRLQALIGLQGFAVLGVCLSLTALLLMLFDGQLNIHKDNFTVKQNGMADFAIKYQLTPREAEILQLLLIKDATNKDFAAELFLSQNTLSTDY